MKQIEDVLIIYHDLASGERELKRMKRDKISFFLVSFKQSYEEPSCLDAKDIGDLVSTILGGGGEETEDEPSIPIENDESSCVNNETKPEHSVSNGDRMPENNQSGTQDKFETYDLIDTDEGEISVLEDDIDTNTCNPKDDLELVDIVSSEDENEVSIEDRDENDETGTRLTSFIDDILSTIPDEESSVNKTHSNSVTQTKTENAVIKTEKKSKGVVEQMKTSSFLGKSDIIIPKMNSNNSFGDDIAEQDTNKEHPSLIQINNVIETKKQNFKALNNHQPMTLKVKDFSQLTSMNVKTDMNNNKMAKKGEKDSQLWFQNNVMENRIQLKQDNLHKAKPSINPNFPQEVYAGSEHKCDLCGKVYSSDKIMRTHQRKYHGAPPRFECKVCSKSLKNEKQLRNHIAMLHQEGAASADTKVKKETTVEGFGKALNVSDKNPIMHDALSYSSNFISVEKTSPRKNGNKPGDTCTQTNDTKAMLKEKAPMKTRSPYMYYCKEELPKLKSINPNIINEIGIKEVNRALGRKWSNLSSDDRQKYEEMSRADSLRYQNEKKEYQDRHCNDEEKNLLVSQQKEKAPKRIRSAFSWYYKEQLAKIREADPDALKNGGLIRMGKVLGQQWCAMSPEEKYKYEDLNKEAKEKYEKERDAYKDSLKKKRSINKFPMLQKAKSAYLWFQEEELENMKETNPDALKPGYLVTTKDDLKKKWNDMISEDKKRFEDLAVKDRARYFEEKRAVKQAAKGPKRVRSAFAYYSKEVIENIKVTEPDALKNGGLVKIVKAIGKRWSTMTSDERSKYSLLSYKDKIRFKQEKRAHKLGVPMQQAQNGVTSLNHVPKTPPKRAMSAFLCFSREYMKNARDKLYNETSGKKESVTNLSKEIGKAWSELSPNKRLKYEELSKIDRNRYNNEKEAHKISEKKSFLNKIKTHSVISESLHKDKEKDSTGMNGIDSKKEAELNLASKEPEKQADIKAKINTNIKREPNLDVKEPERPDDSKSKNNANIKREQNLDSKEPVRPDDIKSKTNSDIKRALVFKKKVKPEPNFS